MDNGCQIYTYDYGKMFSQASREIIQNLIHLRDERRVTPSIKTRFLFKLESDATIKFIIQWVNFISRDCVNGINEDIGEDDDRFETLLPRHEQIYDIEQFKTGEVFVF